MKKLFIAIFAVIGISILIIAGCEDGSNTGGGNVAGQVTDLTDSGCKSFAGVRSLDTPDNLDCLEYQYDGTGTLTLRHINAGFNCCPEKLVVDYDITDNVITIKESETNGLCDCLCLFDLDYSIADVEPGVYIIKVAEPYYDGEDKLEFSTDLTSENSGSYCAERINYPWNLQE